MKEKLHIYLVYVYLCGDGCCSNTELSYHAPLTSDNITLLRKWYGDFEYDDTLYMDENFLNLLGVPTSYGDFEVCGINIKETADYYCD